MATLTNISQVYDEVKEFMALKKEPSPNNFAPIHSKLKSYYYTHCAHPIKIKIFDSHKGQFVERYVPCGNCYHCRQTRKNEWVTRLFYHIEDFKYVYFVTLTYRTFENETLNVYDKFVYEYLHDSYYHLDDFNSLHRMCYRPCVLFKKHYQDYIKRLRKSCGIENITYFGCGEFGHRFGSPHYHFLFFSHEPIDKSYFFNAWGLQLSLDKNGIVHKTTNDNNSLYCPFGRVQVDDLIENGTFRSANIDGKLHTPQFAFQYVAKYVAKLSYNTNRLKLIYDEIPQDLKPNWFEFVKQNRPFNAISRGTAIGSLWTSRNIKKISQGVIDRTELQKEQCKCYVVPNYFRKKVQEYLFSLRSLSSSLSITRGNLPLVARALYQYSNCEMPLTLCNFLRESVQKDYFPLTPIERVTQQNLSYLLSRPGTFVDVRTRSRYIIAYTNVPSRPLDFDLAIFQYQYNRSNKINKWNLIHVWSLEQWCEHYLLQMPDDFANYLKYNRQSELSTIYYDEIKCFYETFGMLDKFLDIPFNENNNKLKRLNNYEQNRYSQSSL